MSSRIDRRKSLSSCSGGLLKKMFPINKVYPKYESIAISRRTWCCGINFVFRWRSSRLRQEPQNATRTETWWAYGLRKNQTGWNLDECGACSHFLLHCLLAVCDFQVTIEFLCFFCIGMDQQNLQQGCSKHPRYKDGNLGKFVKVKWHNYSLVAIIYLEWVGEPCMKYKKHMNPAGWFRDGHFRRNISFKPMGCFPNKYYVTPRLHRPNWSPGSPGPKKDEMLPTATGGEVLACKACAMQDSCRSRCLRIDL